MVIKLTRDQAERKLKQTFGLDHFYDEQWQAIERILAGERVLMIECTGYGKSLCYQFPATLFSGLTVIFSPLIALMRDQVRGLAQHGIKAAYINSEQSPEDNSKVIRQALDGKLKILYIAPERQENNEWLEAVRKMKLSMVVVDEAHTISTWGHDFRPAFQRIINLVKLLPVSLPVLATTATATKRVQADIERQIGGCLTTIRGSLVRKNFHLFVVRVKSNDEKMLWLAEYVNRLPGTGIIYSGTRSETHTYAKWLQYVGVDAIDYNAGFDADTRKETEKGLMENRWKCIVSTNALGMGVDKPDIRFVIHTQIPVSPIHYYQEIGRAGRDGKPTNVVLFYNEAKDSDGIDEDLRLPRSFIDGARPSEKKYRRVVELLQKEPLTEREIIKKANLKQNQARTIKYDLIDQGIIKEVVYNKRKTYEYQYDAPEFDYERYNQLRKARLDELRSMREYVYTTEPRMKYLCRFLDSIDDEGSFANCDNTNLKKLSARNVSLSLRDKLHEFRESFFPELDLCDSTSKKVTVNGVSYNMMIKVPCPNVVEVYRNKKLVGRYGKSIEAADFCKEEYKEIILLQKKHYSEKSRITNGVAASLYGVTTVGAAIHRCKYENGGDFPDFLLRLTLRAFHRMIGKYKYDLVLYVPPTKSGQLVRNFAVKFASAIKTPVGHGLRKVRITKEQKIFQNVYNKRENVDGAFDIYDNVKGKRILLVDDIYDSGATLCEIGKVLTSKGAQYITPIVIAKTVGGTT